MQVVQDGIAKIAKIEWCKQAFVPNCDCDVLTFAMMIATARPHRTP